MKKSASVLSVFMLVGLIIALSVSGHAWAAGESHSILLKRGVIDTSAGAPSLQKQGVFLKFGLTSSKETSDLYIIQFDGPVMDSWKTDLEAMGVKLYSYIPEDAFQARMPAKLVDFVKAYRHVEYVGPFYNTYKIDPGLDALVPINSGIAPSSTAKLSGTYPTVDLKVKVFDDQKVGPVVKSIEGLGGTAEVLSDKEGLNKKFVYAEVPADKVYDVATSPQVEWVEKFNYMRLMNYYGKIMAGITAGIDTPGVFTPGAPGALDMDGSGQVIGIMDTGLDTGVMSTLHNAFSNGTPEGRPKMLGVISYRTDGDWSDVQGHGTHVSGTMAGYDPFNPDLEGAAPGAQIYFQSAQAYADYLVSPPIQDVFMDALKHKAYVHNNSWGIMGGSPAEYDSSCVEVDTFIWEHPTFLPIFACGNEGEDVSTDTFNNETTTFSNSSTSVKPDKTKTPDGYVDEYSVIPPSTSKNVVAVGAAENYADFNFQIDSTYTFLNGTSIWPRDPIYSDNWNDDDLYDDMYGVACFSSRGPTADNRIKPDIIAPGSDVYSVRSQVYPPLMSNDYMYMAGTSMATPFVTGCAADVREYLSKLYGIKTPSAALIKAMLINGARDITPGQYGDGTIDSTSKVLIKQEVYARPDVNQGWGLVDLQNTIFPTPPTYLACVDHGKKGIMTGGGESYAYNIVDTSVPVRVTLVWTDYPGSPAANKALVNDLDLTVFAPDAIYYGNALGHIDSGGHAVIDKHVRAPWLDSPVSYDGTNNVESVEFMPSFTGPIYVNVQGYNVPQGKKGQPYALVVSGGFGKYNPDPLSDGFFSMSGTVTNMNTKLPEPGATVTITGPVRATLTADGSGNFTVTGLIPGTYYVSAVGSLGETTVRLARKKISKKNLTNVKVMVR